jgi:hypothetical protein
MTSYIVRVWRQSRRAKEITGIVEIPERLERLSFQSFRDLEAILLRGGDPARARDKKRGHKQHED